MTAWGEGEKIEQGKEEGEAVTEPPMPVGALPPVSTAPPIRVLLIEDDPGDAYLVQDLLEHSEETFEITWVQTLSEALAVVSTGFECGLLDLGLPDSHGLEALRSLSASQSALAIVVLTGFDDQASGAEALRLGAQDYLTKDSVNVESLTRSIRYAVVRRRGEAAALELREADLLQAENARLERGLLARPILNSRRIEWATRYQPGGRRALLGGDFFDAIELEDGSIRVVVGDVCGHGPDEAALGVALRVAWRALVLADQAPDVTIAALQRTLAAERQNDEIFATLCDIHLHRDLEQAEMRLAGHPNPLLVTTDGIVDMEVEVRGPLLGVLEEAKWPVNHFSLGKEWTLVVFTDGIIEGRVDGGHDRFETTGLAHLLLQSTPDAETLDALADMLIAGAEEANGEPLPDDVALMILSTSRKWMR